MFKKILKGKFLSSVAIVIFLAGLGYFAYVALVNNCEKTVEFSIGSIDPKFNVADKEVESIANDAASRWNSQSNQKLLAYNKDSKLKINLVYDSRQEELDKFKAANSTVTKNSQTVEAAKADLNSMINQYETDLSAYNSEVQSWNSKGGAPKDVYARLENERLTLDQQQKKIKLLASTLNVKIDSYNNQVAQLNDQAKKNENTVITQGLYFPNLNKIDIYTFGSSDELRLVLMHELGHALGLEHDQQIDSIMYYLLSSQNLKNPLPTAEDLSAINDRCRPNNVNLYLSLFKRFRSSLQ